MWESEYLQKAIRNFLSISYVYINKEYNNGEKERVNICGGFDE
jgi:hypothetical protein